MAITTMNALVAALASADQDVSFYFPSGTTVAAGLLNLNRLAGSFGTAAIPTVIGSGGHVPTDVPPGYADINSPGGGQTLYLARMEAACSSPGTIIVYDRVWAASGFSGTSTTAQTVTTPVALPSARAPNSGLGLEMYLESYTAIGATTSNVTVSYTNSSGTASRTTISEQITSTFPANRLQRLRLQDGDVGVQSIQSLTLSANTTVAGNFGIVLLEKKCAIPLVQANVTTVLDFAALGMPDIQSDAALMFVHLGTTTGTGNILGSYSLVAG
jgi:hypothetical protein